MNTFLKSLLCSHAYFPLLSSHSKENKIHSLCYGLQTPSIWPLPIFLSLPPTLLPATLAFLKCAKLLPASGTLHDLFSCLGRLPGSPHSCGLPTVATVQTSPPWTALWILAKLHPSLYLTVFIFFLTLIIKDISIYILICLFSINKT